MRQRCALKASLMPFALALCGAQTRKTIRWLLRLSFSSVVIGNKVILSVSELGLPLKTWSVSLSPLLLNSEDRRYLLPSVATRLFQLPRMKACQICKEEKRRDGF